MAIQLSPAVITEIAGLLDAGMSCFYHISTGELEYYPSDFGGSGFDETMWKETIRKVEKNFEEYIPFIAMESHDSFRLIEDFIDEIEDKTVQGEFHNVIRRRRPFQQFKALLSDYPDPRLQWFGYKDKRLIEYTQDELESYNRHHPGR